MVWTLFISGPRLGAASISVEGLTIWSGCAAILMAPQKVVALVETPNVTVGAVDPRKRKVVTGQVLTKGQVCLHA